MGAEQKHAYKKLSAAISATPPKTPSALVPKSLPAQQDILSFHSDFPSISQPFLKRLRDAINENKLDEVKSYGNSLIKGHLERQKIEESPRGDESTS